MVVINTGFNVVEKVCQSLRQSRNILSIDFHALSTCFKNEIELIQNGFNYTELYCFFTDAYLLNGLKSNRMRRIYRKNVMEKHLSPYEGNFLRVFIILALYCMYYMRRYKHVTLVNYR